MTALFSPAESMRLPSTAGPPRIWLIGFAVLSTFVLSAAAGFRWFGVGPDYLEYVKFYWTVTSYFATGFSRFEAGFEIVAWVFATILNAPFPVFYAAVVAFAIAIKWYTFLRYTSAPLVAFLIFFLMLYPLHEYTQVRVAVGISLAYLGFFLASEQRYLPGLAFFALGLFFHASTIIILPIALASLYIPRRILIGSVVVGGLIVWFYTEEIGIFIVSRFSFNNLLSAIIWNTQLYEDAEFVTLTNICITAALGLLYMDGIDDRFDKALATLTLSGLVLLMVFQSSPVLAFRIKELLTSAIVYLACRQQPTLRVKVAWVLLVVGGAWQVYRSIGVAGGVYT